MQHEAYELQQHVDGLQQDKAELQRDKADLQQDVSELQQDMSGMQHRYDQLQEAAMGQQAKLQAASQVQVSHERLCFNQPATVSWLCCLLLTCKVLSTNYMQGK